MLIRCFINIIISGGISILLCVLGMLVTSMLQGKEMALDLFNAWIFEFNGILVGGVGLGLLWFIHTYGNNLLNSVNNILNMPDELQEVFIGANNKLVSIFWKNLICIPILLLGGFILWQCNYPLEGFAKYYLAVCSISVYYIAGYILSYFVFTLNLFMLIEKNLARLSIKKEVTYFDMDSFNSFFIITSFFGVLAIYFGLRGTLTANFLFADIEFKRFLVLPIVLFLPTTLIYSFYPRFAIKKIYENDLLKRIQQVEVNSIGIEEKISTIKERLETQKILLEIKEKLLIERNKFPIFSLKDSPSLVMSLIVLIQLVLQNDTTISSFIDFIW